MSKKIAADLIVTKQRFALVCSRFNEFITHRLAAGATDQMRGLPVFWWQSPHVERKSP